MLPSTVTEADRHRWISTRTPLPRPRHGRDGKRRDPLATSGEAHPLVGRGLDADLVHVDTKRAGDRPPHLLDVRHEAWSLRDHRRIHIRDRVAARLEQISD